MSQQWRTLPAPLVLSIASGVLLLLLCHHASGLPTGAPTEACDNMTPNHRTHSQGGDGGYQIYHNIGTAYRAGNKYNSTFRFFTFMFLMLRVSGSDLSIITKEVGGSQRFG